MRHWSQSFDESNDATPIHSGDTVNDLSYYDPASETLTSYFGDGRSGAMPNHDWTHNSKSAIAIVSPITGAAMKTTGSFGGLLGK